MRYCAILKENSSTGYFFNFTKIELEDSGGE